LGPAWPSLSTRAGRVWSTLWGKVAAAVVAVIVVAAVVLAFVWPFGGLPSNAAFSVNGKVVTVSQFKSQLSALNGLYGVKAPQAKDAKANDAFLRAAAQALAVNMVLDNAGAKRHLSVSAKAARDTLDQTVNQRYGGNTAAFTQALSTQNLTEADVVTAISHQQMVQKLFPQIAGTVNVTAAQIQQYYQAHTAQLAVPETRAISRIVVSSQASAQSIVTQLQHGSSFATLASQQSADTATKSKGGVLGTLSQSDLAGTTPAFAKAAFAAAPNTAFGPVQDQNLWEVGEVTQVVPPAAATFDAKTQAAIKVILTDQVQLARWTAWLAGQIKAAHITYAAKYRPAHPDQPPNVQIPQLTGESIRNSTIGQTGSGATGNGASGSGTSGSGTSGSGTPGTTSKP
ncbi:MAG: peptidyl-prolyl cis-trans isomerase, partial [Actinomycetes bacterium]